MAWFTVQYRDKSGAKAEAEFEAADRSALFGILAAEKISAIKVTSGRLGKKHGNKPTVKRHFSGGHRSALLWVSSVAACLLVAIYFVFNNLSRGDRDVSREEKHQKSILGPVRHATIGDSVAKPGTTAGMPEGENSSLPKQPTVITNEGPIKAGDPLWREKGYAHPRKAKVFNSASDQILAMVADIAEGKDVPPIPIDKHFEKEFLQSLKVPIEIGDDDSERIVALKESVNELRKELSDRAEAGESAYTIIREFEKTMAENYKIRGEIQEEVRKILEEGDREGAKEYLTQMNQALWKMGIKEVEMPMTAAEKAEFVQQFRQEEAKRRAAKESKKTKENNQ